MSNIVDLAEVRRARTPAPRTRTRYADGADALAAMRAALDALADACAGATEFWPTQDTTWGEIAKGGLQNRLKRIGGRA